MWRQFAANVGLLTAAILACWLDHGNVGAAEARVFRAGAFAADITPRRYPVSVIGSFADRPATRAHDRLHARGLVLDDGRTRVAIVVCDSCLIPRELFDRAKVKASEATGIPVERMLMSATHTHSAPASTTLAKSMADPEYQDLLVAQIAAAVGEAAARLEPARVGWAVGKCPDQVFNRRWRLIAGRMPINPYGRNDDQVKMNPTAGSPDLVEPAGPTDPDVSILAVTSSSGRPLALLANYSLHYVGGTEPDALSADYFGMFAEEMAQRLGAAADGGRSPFVGIMSNGTSGDVNNVNFRQPRPRGEPYERMRQVAARVADVAYEAYEEIEFRDHASLAMAEREITLGVRRPTAETLAWARSVLASGEPLSAIVEYYAREAIAMHEHPGTAGLKLQALRVGELGIATVPCEVFCEMGLEIKQRSPLKPTFTIELANGYNGYLPTPEQHALGGYETWLARSSYLEIEASRKITAAVLELLAQVAARDPAESR